ncbi:MAG: acetylornithine deacetylase/succinyl-diaminopimelate desuccinylase-like protein, partial [Saprospiraceae bacterium]
MQNTQQYISDNKGKFLTELMELLKIPSVSADPAYANDVAKTADFVKASLESAGCDLVEIHKTEGHPIVYAEKMKDPSLPTVL